MVQVLLRNLPVQESDGFTQIGNISERIMSSAHEPTIQEPVHLFARPTSDVQGPASETLRSGLQRILRSGSVRKKMQNAGILKMISSSDVHQGWSRTRNLKHGRLVSVISGLSKAKVWVYPSAKTCRSYRLQPIVWCVQRWKDDR